MKAYTLKRGFINTANSLEIVVDKLINSLKLSSFDTSYNNIRIHEILENKKDEMIMNDAIEELKKSKDIKSKTIRLSNESSLVISIE